MAVAGFGVAALLALAFAGRMGWRWRTGRKPQHGWWLLAFLFYAAAFVTEANTVAQGWHSLWEYRLYLFSSAGLVGTLSIGTGYLAWNRRLARSYAALEGALLAGLAIWLCVRPLALHGSWLALNGGQGSITGWSQRFYVVQVAMGGMIIVWSSLWSAWKFRRWQPLLIAAGALASSTGGTLASMGLGLAVLPLMNVVGLIGIFLGDFYAAARLAGERPTVAHWTRHPL